MDKQVDMSPLLLLLTTNEETHQKKKKIFNPHQNVFKGLDIRIQSQQTEAFLKDMQ